MFHHALTAPHSSQLKDTHLVANAHALVALPKSGRGAHPHNLSLALDGRCWNLIAAKDSLDSWGTQGLLVLGCDQDLKSP